MNNVKAHILFFLSLIVLCACNSGEHPIVNYTPQEEALAVAETDTNLYFKTYDTQNGLISSELFNTYTDRQGYVWISTGKGIIRFDGQSFTPFFDNIEKKVRLLGPTSFFEDSEGTLWIFSGGGYLHWFSREENQINSFSTQLENGWSDEKTMNMLQDNDDTFWIGGYGGIQKVNKTSKKVEVFPIQKIRTMNWPHEEKVRFEIIKKDKAGTLWLGSRKFGLVKYDPAKNRYEFLRDRPKFQNYLLDDWITDIEVAEDSTFWISDFERGLVHFDPISENILDFIELEKLLASPYKVAVRDLLREGNLLWIATNYHGLILFDLRTKKVVRHYHRDNSELPMNKIMSLNRDFQGNYWLAGSELVIASSSFYKFKTVSLPENRPAYALASTENGVLCSSNNGLFSISDDGKSKNMLATDKVSYFGLFEDRKKQLWAGGSFANYVFSPDLSTTIKNYPYDIVVDSVGNYLRKALRITEDSEGRIWIIDNWNRLKYIDPDNNVIKNIFALAQDPVSKKFIQTTAILDDPKYKRLLVGTDMGLLTISYNDLSLEWQKNSLQQQEAVDYLYRDKKGGIWGILASHIFQIDPDNLVLSPFSFKDRGANETYNWIVEEPLNTYWIQSSLGIVKYKDSSSTVYENHNFSEGSFNKPAPVITHNGKVYYGGDEGVSIIDPALLKIDRMEPKVNLSYLKFPYLDKESRAFDTTFYRGNNTLIELDHYQNRIHLKFDGLHYKEPENNLIKYKLLGYDKEFSFIKNGLEANYTNLNPGAYTLVYAAANSDGVWSEESTFEIKIHPPWYQTWWARVIYVLLAIAGIYAWIRYRVFLKLEKFKATEEIRTTISADLHDDVGSLLAGLSMKSELMAMGVKEIESESLLKISEMAREAMERMRDTVWAIDSRKDKYENLTDRMRSFADQNLPEKGFKYHFILEGLEAKSFISPLIRQNLYLILKEAITNIVKHSDGNEVEIKLKKVNDDLNLNIKDNGRKKDKLPTDGLGLSNMKARARKIGGSLQVFYNEGFSLNLQLKC